MSLRGSKPLLREGGHHNSLLLHGEHGNFLYLPLYTSPLPQSQGFERWKKHLFALLVCSTLLIFLQNAHQFLTSKCDPAQSTVHNLAYLITAEYGAVASENKRCSDIGVEVMKEGGNAVDAAISAALCIGVVNMFS